MGKSGDEFADMVGPPGSKSKYGKSKLDDDEGSGDESESSGEGDMEAAELSAFEEYKDALQSGSADEGLAAFKKLLDICG